VDDEFFVGYLPAPRGVRRFALAAGAIVLGLVAGVAWLLAATMRRPAPIEAPRYDQRFVGRLETRPYGILWTLENGAPTATLIVRGGKWGVPREAARLDGQIVEVSGSLWVRQGHRVIELGGPIKPARLPPDEAARLVVPEERLGEVTLKGEIVDSKCHVGRMRPGDGRPHRGCAQLCLAGGVPPVLVTHGPDGAEGFYLLVDDKGEAAGAKVLPFAAEPIRCKGQLAKRANLTILGIDASTFERL
jgi:hypothetical protein